MHCAFSCGLPPATLESGCDGSPKVAGETTLSVIWPFSNDHICRVHLD